MESNNERKIEDFTLREVKSYCEGMLVKHLNDGEEYCRHCKFRMVCDGTPDAWDFDVRDKPYLAEIIGVDIGEKFKIGTFDGVYCIEDTGYLHSDSGLASLNILTYLINNPNDIAHF